MRLVTLHDPHRRGTWLEELKPGDYPVAEREFEKLISLPLFPLMEDSDVDRVVNALGDIVEAHRA